MKIAKLLLVVAAGAGTALAQGPIRVELDGGAFCPVRAWSFGATGGVPATTGSGAGAGKAQISNLVTTRQLDDCSVNFFKLAVVGTHLNRLILRQMDTSKADLIVVQLDNVLVSSYQLTGDAASPNPTESVAFSFGRITVIYNGGIRFTWDILKNTGS